MENVTNYTETFRQHSFENIHMFYALLKMLLYENISQ